MYQLFYKSSHLNEDFRNKGYNPYRFRELEWIDNEEDDILQTSLRLKPVTDSIYLKEIDRKVQTYSIFTRVKHTNIADDSNPVLYALKNEQRWQFTSELSKQRFWNRFSEMLHLFLKEHKNEFDTTILIPSSNHLNKDILEEIKKYASEAGITYICEKGFLHTLSTDEIRTACEKDDSYFRKFWGDRWFEQLDELDGYLDIKDSENNGIFKYHAIKNNPEMRKPIVHTLKTDIRTRHLYKEHINGKHVLIVDDSITFGQSIRNAVYAIYETYNPRTVSILTMFSKLYYDPDYKYRDFDGSYFTNN